LKSKQPGKSGVWYSRQIARMDIAHDRAAETIRKNMKRKKSWANWAKKFRPTERLQAADFTLLPG
jgi:hypothetical protein